jgi:hypothetical protein
LVTIQGNNNKFTINKIFPQLFGKPEPPKVDWEWGEQKLNRQLSDIYHRLNKTLRDDTLMDVTAEEQPSWVHRSLQAERTLQVDGQDYGSLDPNTPSNSKFKILTEKPDILEAESMSPLRLWRWSRCH